MKVELKKHTYLPKRAGDPKRVTWTFTPIGDNGEPQAQSEQYTRRSNARRGARNLLKGQDLEFFVRELPHVEEGAVVTRAEDVTLENADIVSEVATEAPALARVTGNQYQGPAT